ncbi:glycosyltransferase family 9 protein [Pedobacter yulinensis]|nr:glycosyltransferase family 9 protein [Pedobacter yulinensis]
MGDVLMSSPAIRALKETFGCHVALLTSEKGAAAAHLNPFIDEVIVCDLPWQKFFDRDPGADSVLGLVNSLRERNYDGCVVLTVYSQNPMPCIMLGYLAGIPRRLAYCRENPYGLLTNWLPDKEPYSVILHQVTRDLDLVAAIGAQPSDDHLVASVSDAARRQMHAVLKTKVKDSQKPLLLISPQASESRRGLSPDYWSDLLALLHATGAYSLVLCGTAGQRKELNVLSAAAPDAITLAGELAVDELAALIECAAVVLTVNTGTVHLAAALGTPVCVLYARTNPQHTPWKVVNKVFYYSPETAPSRNEVVAYVNGLLYQEQLPPPHPETVVAELGQLCRIAAP